MVYKHAFNCIQCRQQVTFKTNNANCDNPKLPSLFHSELETFVRAKYKENTGKAVTHCMGRLLHASSTPLGIPDFAVQIKAHAPTISYGNLSALAKAWVVAMRANGNASCNVATHLLPVNCSNNNEHNTDPRTGQPRHGGVGVREYYVGGAAGDRATARSGPGGNGLELFWSTTHIANTYNYHLIINIP